MTLGGMTQLNTDLAERLREDRFQSLVVFDIDRFHQLNTERGDVEQVFVLAERIRGAIAERTEGTVSVGIYCGIPTSIDAAVGVADTAMYSAKSRGGNQIVTGSGDRRS